jgi:hypothetical protein
LLGLYAALMDGIRPRAWDAGLVQRLLAKREDVPDDVGANLYGYYYALDSGRVEEAGILLDLAIVQREALPTSFRAAVTLEKAFFEAFHQKRAAEGRAWLKEAIGQAERQTWLRAEAAVLLAERRFEEACAKAEAGLAAIPQSADPGGSLAEADWLDAVLAESRSKRFQMRSQEATGFEHCDVSC